MQRFFVTQAPHNGEVVVTDKQQLHQITKVLRLRVGDRSIVIFDGMEYEVEFTVVSTTEVRGKVLSSSLGLTLSHDVVLCVALLKNDKLEWVVQKATELGVGRIILMKTKRCVKQEVSDSFLERLKVISQEAAEQSESAQIPEIEYIGDFSKALDICPKLGDVYMLFERGGKKHDDLKKGVFLVGPEGGFDESEVLEAIEKHVHMLSLGKRILRAETACVAILAKILL